MTLLFNIYHFPGVTSLPEVMVTAPALIGLSPGELRQAMLDEFRGAGKEAQDWWVQALGAGEPGDIEWALYDTEDEVLDHSVWPVPGGIIYAESFET